jgi:phosphoribosyl-AMP cyclohydrolase
MLGYMNEESLRRTLATGEAWFYSRSRKKLWHKGESSGNVIKVVKIWQDCDSDTILVKGRPTGPVCHTGERSCFFQELEEEAP